VIIIISSLECYLNGHGVPVDLGKAISLFKQSSEQDNTRAQYNLGKCFSKGRGVEKNETEGQMYFRIAALQGISQNSFITLLNEQDIPNLNINLL
jgi:TPR repeat protein